MHPAPCKVVTLFDDVTTGRQMLKTRPVRKKGRHLEFVAVFREMVLTKTEEVNVRHCNYKWSFRVGICKETVVISELRSQVVSFLDQYKFSNLWKARNMLAKTSTSFSAIMLAILFMLCCRFTRFEAWETLKRRDSCSNWYAVSPEIFTVKLPHIYHNTATGLHLITGSVKVVGQD